MQKWFKRGLILVFGFIFLLSPLSVLADENKIENIHIDIQLQEDGSAVIRETRQMETSEHTEIYIVLNNLQETELMDFSVEGFTEEPNWDIDASFEEKAGKYGVIDTDDGYELAWGITEYGEPTYEVTYTLSNLVRRLEDGESLFWNFDSFLSLPTDRLTLEVSTPFPIEEKLLSYYGFGFEGPMTIEDGMLRWTGYGLDDGDDAIVLMQFPLDTFQTSASVDQTLAEQEEMATAGSSYNEEEPMPLWGKVLISLIGVTGAGITSGAVAYGVKGRKVRQENNHFYPSTWLKENKDRKDSTPPRLPGDIGHYSALISQVSLEGGGFSDYFFAYLLLWSLEGRIQIETTETERKWFGPKIEAEMTIIEEREADQLQRQAFIAAVEAFEAGHATLEDVLWAMVLDAADSHDQLDGDVLEDWTEDHAEEISDVMENMDELSKDWLVENDYLIQKTKKTWGVDIKIEELTPKGEEVVTSIIQFDNFLTQIKEEELMDYENWDELMIWAAILGKAEDTVEYLEEFHPRTWDYLLDSYPYVYGNYYGYHAFYTSSSSGLSQAGYDSSGGGFSSGGGGAGAGGGGGGGSR